MYKLVAKQKILLFGKNRIVYNLQFDSLDICKLAFLYLKFDKPYLTITIYHENKIINIGVEK